MKAAWGCLLFAPGIFSMVSVSAAELVVTGGVIYTVNEHSPRAEAIAIEGGKSADFVVLDRDISTASAWAIERAQLLATVLRGQLVYEAPRE